MKMYKQVDGKTTFDTKNFAKGCKAILKTLVGLTQKNPDRYFSPKRIADMTAYDSGYKEDFHESNVRAACEGWENHFEGYVAQGLVSKVVIQKDPIVKLIGYQANLEKQQQLDEILGKP